MKEWEQWVIEEIIISVLANHEEISKVSPEMELTYDTKLLTLG